MQRHAILCVYPQIPTGVEGLRQVPQFYGSQAYFLYTHTIFGAGATGNAGCFYNRRQYTEYINPKQGD